MDIVVASASSYPRPEWFRKYLKRVEGLQKDLDARIDPFTLKKAQLEVLENQEKCGVDVLTEGMLIWHDFLATVTLRAGFKPDGLARYFENNLYYRVPVLESLGELRRPHLNDFRLATEVWKKNRELKAVTSCLTAFYLSKCRTDEKKAFRLFLDLFFDELSEIFKITKTVQLDEPVLAENYKCNLKQWMLDSFLEALECFNARGKLWISTYFSGLDETAFSSLIDLCDVMFLDFVEGSEVNLRNLKEYGCKEICAGIADGRNTRMESLEELERKTLEILEVCSLKRLYVSTNTGLEFLPEVKAYEKMNLLSKFSRFFEVSGF